jgi:NADPH:quinone reductase
MTGTTQKAVVLHEIGAPLRLESGRPILNPGPRQVLVRVTVAGLNPHDQKSRDVGLFAHLLSLPAVLSNDVVGVVTEVGESVSGRVFEIGDRIVGQANWVKGSPHGGLQEFALLDIEHACRVPNNISDDEAATLPTNFLAPLIALFVPEKLGFRPPWQVGGSGGYDQATLLVIGGGSACGKFTTQLARLAGIGRIVVVGGDESELKAYGATEVLSRFGEPEAVQDRIRASVGNDLRYVIDTVNVPEDQHVGINALSLTEGGKLVRLRRTGQVRAALVREGAKYELVDIFGSSFEYPEVCKPFWERLPGYLRDGEIRPTTFSTIDGLDPDKINKVLDGYRDGVKVVKPNVHVS